MGSATSILLTEEDPAMRAFLADNLTADGYDVHAVENRAAALAALETDTPGLVIADVNGDTLTLIDAVRGADGLASRIAPDTPLIVLTGRGDELARIRYLDRGSDDVLARPFSYPELRARVRALLRRAGAPTLGRVVRVGALTIDTARARRARGRPPGRAQRQGVRAAGAPRDRARRACSRSPSCSATSGASARRAPRARSRATPTGCAASSSRPRRAASAGSTPSGASATGSSPIGVPDPIAA